jgi:hypothetical protein
MPRIVLHLLAGEFAVCRLAPEEPVPAWAGSGVYSGAIRAPGELTVVCPADQVPADVRHEGGWRILRFEGPFSFTDTGVLSAALAPLAAVGIPILAQSTFDTDFLFIKSADLMRAIEALAGAGHAIRL